MTLVKGYAPKTIGQIVSKGYTDHQQKRSKNKKFKKMKLAHGVRKENEQAPGDDDNQTEEEKT